MHEEAAVALQVRETEAVRGLAQIDQSRERVVRHRLMVVSVNGEREDVRRVERKTVADSLRDAGYRCQDSRGGVRQALVHGGWIEADACRLCLELSDSSVDLLREDAAKKEEALPHSGVVVHVEGRASDGLDDRKR